MRNSVSCLVLVMSIVACDGSAPEDRIEFFFSDRAGFQAGNVTTRLVSPELGIGLDLLLDGWKIFQPDILQVWRERGTLGFFSFEGEGVVLTIECVGEPSEGNDANYLYVRVNGKYAGGFSLATGSNRHELALAARLIKKGANRLSLHPRARLEGHEKNALLKIRKLELVGSHQGAGRSQLEGISLLSSRAGRPDARRPDARRPVLRMPAESFLDMVVRVPAGGRLRGSYIGEGQAAVRADLLDDDGIDHVLFASPPSEQESFDHSLDSWIGELVRLRLTVGGRKGEVRFSEASVIGTRGVRESPPLVELESPPRSGRLGTPDVVFILLDAARADAFSPFGSEHQTPAVEQLAGEGTRFTTAISPSAYTAQSIPSILTGLNSAALGTITWTESIPASSPTLAELMKAHGYRTVLWSQHPLYESRSDLRRGFDVSIRSPRGRLAVVPDENQLFDGARPTFSFIHLLPPHAPYNPPEPFSGSLTEWYEGSLKVDPDSLIGLAHAKRVDEEDLHYIRSRYQEMVSFADDLVGRIVDLLRAQGRFDDALVVLLSDHGEAFFEHGLFLHTKELYREFVHVPLIVKWPRSVSSFRQLVTEPVSLLDLVPTIVDGVGIDTRLGFQGRSLLSSALDSIPRPGPILAATVGASRWHAPPHSSMSLLHGDWQLIYRPTPDRVELYQWRKDPDNHLDLSQQEPLRALLLSHAVRRQDAYDRSLGLFDGWTREVEELSQEIDAELRSLGYI